MTDLELLWAIDRNLPDKYLPLFHEMEKQAAAAPILLAALELIRGNGCHNYYLPHGACITLRPDGRLSEYTADSWCDSCIAHEAITIAKEE